MPIRSKCRRRGISLRLKLAGFLLIQIFVIWGVVWSRQSLSFDKKLCGVDQQRINHSTPVTYSDPFTAQVEKPTTTSKPVSKKTTTKPVIDMVNDYQPFVDFSFVFPQIIPTIEGSRNFFLIILVNSAAKGKE